MDTPSIILNPNAPAVSPPEVRSFLDAELITFSAWVADYVSSCFTSPVSDFAPRLTGWVSKSRGGYDPFAHELCQPETEQQRDELRMEVRKVIMERQPHYVGYIALWQEGLGNGLEPAGDICGRQLVVSSAWNSLGDSVLTVRRLKTDCSQGVVLEDPCPVAADQRLNGWLPEVIRCSMATSFVLGKAGVNEVSRLL